MAGGSGTVFSTFVAKDRLGGRSTGLTQVRRYLSPAESCIGPAPNGADPYQNTHQDTHAHAHTHKHKHKPANQSYPRRSAVRAIEISDLQRSVTPDSARTGERGRGGKREMEEGG